MPLLGHHSQNPGGSPQVLQALQALQQRAQAGDTQAAATLRTIAAGGKTSGSAVPGWNETLDWSNANDTPGSGGGRAAERAGAQALRSGNQGQFDQIAQNAGATHKDWTGGTLADLAPAAGAFIPGIGPLAAAGLGAAAGGLSAAGGLTNRSVLGGAARGAATAGLAGAGRQALSRALAPGGQGLATTAGRTALSALPGLAAGQNPATALAGGNRSGGGTSLGDLAQYGLAAGGVLSGAANQGQAEAYRKQALAQVAPGSVPTPDLSATFAQPENPFARRRLAAVNAQRMAVPLANAQGY